MRNNYLVSVIIPAFNEEKYISKCIESLLAQVYQPLEIIVVDDGSTDQTREIVGRYPVKLLTQEHKGPGSARNYGAIIAKGEILIFLDADMELPPNFVEKMSLPIIKGIAIGTLYRYEEVANVDLLGKLYAGARGLGELKEKEYPFFRAIKKEVFQKLGGFDVSLDYFDDTSLPEKLGKKALIVDAKCFHRNPDTLAEIFSQEVWRSKSLLKKKGFRIRYLILPTYLLITVSLMLIFVTNRLLGLYSLLLWIFVTSLFSLKKWKNVKSIKVFFIYPLLLLTNGLAKIVALYYYIFHPKKRGK